MSDSPGTDGRLPVVTPTRLIAGVCLFIPFVAMLWVFLSSALTFTAYVLVRREERARKGEQV